MTKSVKKMIDKAVEMFYEGAKEDKQINALDTDYCQTCFCNVDKKMLTDTKHLRTKETLRCEAGRTCTPPVTEVATRNAIKNGMAICRFNPFKKRIMAENRF
jgi:hypothetical protein